MWRENDPFSGHTVKVADIISQQRSNARCRVLRNLIGRRSGKQGY